MSAGMMIIAFSPRLSMLALDWALRALAESHHDGDRRHANQDTERRETGAKRAPPERAERDRASRSQTERSGLFMPQRLDGIEHGRHAAPAEPEHEADQQRSFRTR